MDIIGKGVELFLSFAKEWMDCKEFKAGLISNLESILKCYLDDDFLLHEVSSKLIDIVLNLRNKNITDKKVYKKAVSPVLIEYDIEEISIEDLTVKLVDCVLNTIDLHYSLLLKLNDDIGDIKKLCIEIKQSTTDKKDCKLETIRDVDQKLKDNRIVSGFDLSFFDYDNDEFAEELRRFVEDTGRNHLYIRYRCQKEAYYCTLAILDKLGYAEKIRIITNKDPYESQELSDDKIYILNFDITGELLKGGFKYIAFYYDYDNRKRDDKYGMKPGTRTVLRRNLEKANKDNELNVYRVMEETHGEFNALFPLLVHIHNKHLFETSSSKEVLKLLMLLGGWCKTDESVINETLFEKNEYTISQLKRQMIDSYLDYKSDPFMVGFNDLFGEGKRYQILSPDYVWSYFVDRIDEDDYQMFCDWMRIVFSSGVVFSNFFKINLLLNSIRLFQIPSFKNDVSLLDSIFSLFNQNPDAFDYCYEYLAELDGNRFLTATAGKDYSNEYRYSDYYRALSLLLCRRQTAVDVLYRVMNLYVSGNDGYQVKSLFDISMLAWFGDSAIKLNDIKRLFKKYPMDKCWNLAYGYLPQLSGASLGTCPAECKVLAPEEHGERNYHEFYTFYISYCVENCSTLDRFIRLLESKDFAVYAPDQGKLFIDKLNRFISEDCDDNARYKLELGLRKVVYGHLNSSYEKYFHSFISSLSDILDSLEYDNPVYRLLWRFSYEPYEYYRYCKDESKHLDDMKNETEKAISNAGFSFGVFIGIIDLIKKEVNEQHQENRFIDVGRYIRICYYPMYSLEIVENLMEYPDGVILGYLEEAVSRNDVIDTKVLYELVLSFNRGELLLNVLLMNIDGKSVDYISSIDDSDIRDEFWNRYRVIQGDIDKGQLLSVLNGMIGHAGKDDHDRMHNLLLTVFCHHKSLAVNDLYDILFKSTYVFSREMVTQLDCTFIDDVIKDIPVRDYDFAMEHLQGLLRIELFYTQEREVKEGFFFRYCFSHYPEVYVELIDAVCGDAYRNPPAENIFSEMFDYNGCFGIYEDIGVFIGNDGVVEESAARDWLEDFQRLLVDKGTGESFYSQAAHLFCFAPRVECRKVQICDEAASILNDLILEDLECNGDNTSAFSRFYLDMINSRGSYLVDYKSSATLADLFEQASMHYKQRYEKVASCYANLGAWYRSESQREFSVEVNDV